MAKPTEISLAEVTAVFRKNWWKIVGWSIVAAGVAAVLCLVLPKAYQASTELLVLKPAFKESEADFSQLVPETLSVQTCQTLLNSSGLIEEVFSESGMRDEGKMTLEDFSRKLRTRTRIEQETNYEVLFSPVITLYATAETPEMAKKVADTWADLFVKKANKIQSDQARDAYQFIQSEFGGPAGSEGLVQDAAGKPTRIVEVTSKTNSFEALLREAEEKLRDFELENNIDLMTTEKENKELLLTQFQAKAAEADVGIAAAEEKLAKLEEKRETTQDTLSLKKAITDDPLWLSRFDQKGKPEFPEALQKEALITQTVNPTYLVIEEEIVTAQGELDSFRGELRRTNEKITELESDIGRLQEQLAEANMKSTRLNRDVEDYTITHKLVVTERDKAKLATGRTAGDVRIWSPAVLPEKPIFPRNKKVVVALAFMVGLISSSGYFLFRDVVVRAQTPANASAS